MIKALRFRDLLPTFQSQAARGKEHDDVQALKARIRKKPSDVDARMTLGETYKRMGLLPDVIREYSRIIDLYPRYASITKELMAEAHVRRGEIYVMQSKNDLALQDYSDAIKTYPKCYDAFVDRATLHAKSHDWQSAVDDLTTAIRLNPTASTPYANRCIARIQMADSLMSSDQGKHLQELGLARKDIEQAWKIIMAQGAPDLNNLHVNNVVSIMHAFGLTPAQLSRQQGTPPRRDPEAM